MRTGPRGPPTGRIQVSAPEPPMLPTRHTSASSATAANTRVKRRNSIPTLPNRLHWLGNVCKYGTLENMSVRIVQVDAFTNRPFAGNPAAVCVLPAPAPEEWMRNVAREMNLSETAFLVPRDGGFHLRWLTPTLEVDLCGHRSEERRVGKECRSRWS